MPHDTYTMNILITGFEGSNELGNASGSTVASLIEDLPRELKDISHRLQFELIETDETSPEACQRHLVKQLEGIIKHHDPGICIFTGQAPSYNRIRIERFTTNFFLGKPIDKNAPPAYSVNLPGNEEIPAVLNQNNIPAGHSNNAGQHTCNHILYSMLHMAATKNIDIRAGFVHIPILPEQVANAKVFPFKDSPSMAIEQLRAAMSHIIKQVVAHEHVGRISEA